MVAAIWLTTKPRVFKGISIGDMYMCTKDPVMEDVGGIGPWVDEFGKLKLTNTVRELFREVELKVEVVFK
jgi:hypothetical protein